MNENLQRRSRLMQMVRKIHRVSGINLIIFILIVSVTGILLGWKKNSNEWLMPNTYKGSSQVLSEWLSVDSLNILASHYLRQSVSPQISVLPDRMDIRQLKGVAKFSYKEHSWSVQVDGVTGELLHVGRRHADVIEAIHDGSIIDNWLGLSNGFFKLFFTSVMGFAFLLFIASGFWLWYGTK